jgi:hypothetical protein
MISLRSISLVYGFNGAVRRGVISMIDRSESHLIAREQRNRGDASNTDGVRPVRARRFGIRAGAVHEPVRATRVEPTVGDPTNPATKHPR